MRKRGNSRSDLAVKFLRLPKSNRSDSRFEFLYNNNFLNSKHSQLTIFIIFAILILFIIAILFFIKSNSNIKEITGPEVEPIHSFVRDCIKETAEDGIYNIGQSGGYYSLPNLTNDLGNTIYFYQEENHMPSKEIIENQLARYVDDLMFLCTRNFVEFQGFDVSEGKRKVNVSIEDNKVIFDVTYPITIIKGDKTYFFKNFNGIEIPVRLGTIYNLADKIINKQLENPEYVCLNCIEDWASEKDLYVNMIDYENDSVIFTITDDKSFLKDENYSFIFANLYKSESSLNG